MIQNTVVSIELLVELYTTLKAANRERQIKLRSQKINS